MTKQRIDRFPQYETGMFPVNSLSERRVELFESLSSGDLINEDKVMTKRTGSFVQSNIDKVLEIARKMNLTYSELEDFLELIKLTAFDYRVR
ncbi:hypothetical protein CIW83_09650 [Tissierella sp. P1]|uniref:hypothetical protein n=1 Tax=Tissierella sp. P1 TaxID=1280483 RepID=UPI000BA17EFD|nr:hypothetical protein [Tissierella sp. P1]OZV12351.1 hypothetical protein CIW83_09650 [Tissierella sp. P1]